MKFDAGPEQGNINPGIYQLDADTWKICLATRGDTRPSAFVSPPGSGFALETLAREGVRPAKKKKPSAAETPLPSVVYTGPETELEGEWKMVSGIMDGRPMEESSVEWVRRVTEGNVMTVFAGPQTMLKVEFSVDASTTPKSIDYLNLAGRNKGKSQYGIYEFEGRLLKICVSHPGHDRPTEFRSKPGERKTLTEWRKA